MARIHKWCVVAVYGSLQAEFMEIKYNGHIRRYGTPIFGKKTKKRFLAIMFHMLLYITYDSRQKHRVCVLQAISCTNDDPLHWRMYALPGINELMPSVCRRHLVPVQGEIAQTDT